MQDVRQLTGDPTRHTIAALWEKWGAAKAEYRTVQQSALDPSAMNKACEEANDRCMRVFDELVAAPSTSLADAVLKLRMIIEHGRDFDQGDPDDLYGAGEFSVMPTGCEKLVLDTIADLERWEATQSANFRWSFDDSA